MCWAKNRRCESYRVTSPLGFVHSIPGTLIRYVSLHVRVRRRAASLETLFLCLNRSPIRYGFRAGAKALRSTSLPGFSPTRSMGAGRREPLRTRLLSDIVWTYIPNIDSVSLKASYWKMRQFLQPKCNLRECYPSLNTSNNSLLFSILLIFFPEWRVW